MKKPKKYKKHHKRKINNIQEKMYQRYTVENELADILAKEIAAEIDKEIINSMNSNKFIS